ncbi:hypothetical protein [Burkholderia sp. Ac-20379]|uniref:hypothetical protein n=1 Tax=Burkholderia sp. Ac-20379 TaxID=2703900 RepID=UPI001980E909|nr:hypothetical protein [Burkholderia sp. Ac-20379]MBN3728678.1 hypothetical protein [Burkholderia sp. Ac-20379]
MNTSLALAAQFLLPVPIGYAIARYLRAVTRDLLIDLCGTVGRADFWTRITMVMLVLGPLVLTLALATSPAACSADDTLCVIGALRMTVVWSLLGAIVPLIAIASRIARQVPVDANPAAPSPAVSQAAAPVAVEATGASA